MHLMEQELGPLHGRLHGDRPAAPLHVAVHGGRTIRSTAPKFLDAYRQIDALAGRFSRKLYADDELIILSDHGFTTLKREVYLNVWLEERLSLLPARRRAGSSMAIDRSTRAFSLDPGRIYLNLAAGNLAGPCSRLRACPDRRTGRRPGRAFAIPTVGEVILSQDLSRRRDLQGPWRDKAPDLLVMRPRWIRHQGTFESTRLTGERKLVGMHKYDNAPCSFEGIRSRSTTRRFTMYCPPPVPLMRLDCPKMWTDGRCSHDPATEWRREQGHSRSSMTQAISEGRLAMRRVYVIGFDGATWRFLQPLVQRARCPNFERLMREGSHGELMS